MSKSVLARFVGRLMCIVRAATKSGKKVSRKIKNVGDHLRRNLTGLSQGSSTDGTGAKDREAVLSQDLLLLKCAGIYKLSFKSESKVRVGIAEAQFQSTEWVSRFKTGVLKENFFKEVPSSAVLKARTRQLLLDTSRTRKRVAKDVLC